jgi:hypothetical protein
LYLSDDRTQAGIACAAENLLRKRVRERSNLARRTTEPVVRHCTGEREAILDDVQSIHVVFRRIHSSPRSECGHRLEIALAAIEKIAIQSKNDISAIEFRNEPRASPECRLHSDDLLLTQEGFINAPAHARESFFQLGPQAFTRRRMRFPEEERETVTPLTDKRVAKRSDVRVKLRAITGFTFLNEAL